MADASKAPTEVPPKQDGLGDEEFQLQHNFKLIIDGVTNGHFTRCSGLQVDIETIAYCEAGDHPTIRRLPGRVSYSPVTLEGGVIKADNQRMWDWLKSGMGGEHRPEQVSIVLLGCDGMSERLRYVLNRCWPCGINVGQLDALGRSLHMNSITLVYESLDII